MTIRTARFVLIAVATVACGGQPSNSGGAADASTEPDATVQPPPPRCRFETWLSYFAPGVGTNNRALWLARIGDQPLGPAMVASGTHEVTTSGDLRGSSPDGRFVQFFEPGLVPELFVTDLASGTPAEPLSISAPTEHAVRAFAWSPDSTRIAFLTSDGKTWLTRLTDTPVRAVTAATPPYSVNGYASIAWSPGSEHVVHSRRVPGTTTYQMYLATPGQPGTTVPEPLFGEPLGSGSSVDSSPSWSTDGSVLSYNGTTAVEVTAEGAGEPWLAADGLLLSPGAANIALVHGRGLFIADLSQLPPASEPRRIDGEGTIAAGILDLQWAPDGRGVAYRAAYLGEEDYKSLYFAHPDGSERVKLNAVLPTNTEVRSFTWSPDGSALVYRADEDQFDRIQLYLVRFDGVSPSPAVRISSNAPHDDDVLAEVRWSPDGRHVAFVTDQDVDDEFELFVVDVNGDLTPIQLNPDLTAGGDVGSIHWSPDGTRIAYGADQDIDGVHEAYVVALDAPGVSYKVNGPLPFAGGVSSLDWVACEPE